MGLSVYLYKDFKLNGDDIEFDDSDMIHHFNITHNLNKMAIASGLYDVMWRPYTLIDGFDLNFSQREEFEFEDSHLIRANFISKKLEQGLDELLSNKEEYVIFNPSNGWGNYDNLVNVARTYLHYCKEYPDSYIRIFR